MDTQYIMVGEVLRPQGIHGELKVRPITDDPHRFAELTYVYTEPKFTRREISSVRVREDFVYLRLEGVLSRSDAEKERGLLLYINRENAVKLPEGSNFICDLVGCNVCDENGKEYGVLTDVLQPGANDVYIVTDSATRKNMLIPALKHVILDVDVGEKRILIDSARLSEVAVFED